MTKFEIGSYYKLQVNDLIDFYQVPPTVGTLKTRIIKITEVQNKVAVIYKVVYDSNPYECGILWGFGLYRTFNIESSLAKQMQPITEQELTELLLTL